MRLLLMTLYVIFTVAPLYVYIYNLWIILAGRRHRKEPYDALSEKENRFCIIICARNEERVIAQLINSLHEQEYPKDKLDIYVIADNCTDSTAQIAKEKNAHVMVRNDTSHIGKGYALSYFFQNINPSDYDAFCIFDADNLVDKRFIRIMNSRINSGEKIIQGGRRAANPGESPTSSCYALYFDFITKIYFKARMNRGMACTVSGTGFAFTSDLVANGWSTSSITEDAEFSIQNLLHGVKVTLAENAVFYDEQPASFMQSIPQRRRRSAGTMQLLKKYGKKLAQLASDETAPSMLRKSAMDYILFMLMVPTNAMPIISGFLGTLLLFMIVPDLSKVFLWMGISCAASYILNVIFAYIVLIATKDSFAKMWKGLLFYPIFCFSWSIISFTACINNKCKWKPIEHKGKKGFVLDE